MAGPCPRHARFSPQGRSDDRLRQQHRQMAMEEGVADAFDFPGFVPAYIRPLFCRGIGPSAGARCRARPRISAHRRQGEGADPRRSASPQLLDHARRRIKFQGLPARICWLGLGARARIGLAFNEMVARGELAARSSSAAITSIRARLRVRTRDRGDARRLRRGCRLAAPQRHAQRRLRRDVGVDAQWRRHRHWLFTACRDGHRLRGTEAAARRIERV